MYNLKSIVFSSLVSGLFVCLVWFAAAFLSAQTVILAVKLILIFSATVLVIFLSAVPTVKKKLVCLLLALVVFGMCYGIGRAIGLDILTSIGIDTGLHLHHEAWLLYPFIGLLTSGVIGLPVLFFCIVEAESTIKERWRASGEILLFIAGVALVLYAGSWFVTL